MLNLPGETLVPRSSAGGIASAVRRAVQDGVGLMYAPVNYVEGEIAKGQLMQVLEDWMPETLDSFFLYYPSRRQPTPAGLAHPVAAQIVADQA